jgi:hypothetical protein
MNHDWRSNFCYCTIQVSRLRYFDVVLQNIYSILYICHGVVQSGGSVPFLGNGDGGRMATARHYNTHHTAAIC